MPIYEYACQDCGREFETLVRSDTVPACPQCHSTQLDKGSRCSRPPPRPLTPRLRCPGPAAAAAIPMAPVAARCTERTCDRIGEGRTRSRRQPDS